MSYFKAWFESEGAKITGALVGAAFLLFLIYIITK